MQYLIADIQKTKSHTWFWTRSLTRSMGAAAVFETAAETPPTGGSQYTFVGGVPPVDIGVIYGGSVSSVGSMSGIVGSKHTQEVHHEGL
jgi:hypothetical protein